MLKISDLSYKINEKILLNNISLVAEKTDIILINGESGIGKSTLLRKEILGWFFKTLHFFLTLMLCPILILVQVIRWSKTKSGYCKSYRYEAKRIVDGRAFFKSR